MTVLSTTPIKGFALHHPESVSLDANGAVGDRDFFLIDEEQRLLSITRTGIFASWKADVDRDAHELALTHPDGRVLQDAVVLGEPVVGNFEEGRDVPGRVVGGKWAPWLSELAGRPVSLVRANESGGAFDEHPVTLLSDASVADLREGASVAIDARRFRMLMGISGVSAYEEESWQSQTVRVGTALLRLEGPVPRCNATTRNPDSGERDLKTLALITSRRGMLPNAWGDGLNLGVYADVLEPGAVSVGDELVFTD
ncbi:MAG: MOSC domain-containing protein [Actinomycetia bacterium]|nr:MOSC domain-containing protein [Actinomycetes bacterium]